MKERVRFRHRVEYAAFRILQGGLMPFPIGWVGRGISGVLSVVLRVAWPLKRETVSRLREVFGEAMTIGECRRIVHASLWNMTMNFVEMFRVKHMDLEYLRKHLEGTAEAQKKLRFAVDKYGGVVIALPHMGNWDLAGVTCSAFGFPLMALARSQNNPLFEGWLQRNRLNVETADRRHPSSFVRVAHHLKSGGVFAILPDVRHNKPGVSVTVFGKPGVQLGKGLAKFSRMANVPILPVMMERLDASHHRIHCGEPILPNLDAPAEEDAVRVTQQVWDLFEARIRQAPEQWFWHNRRWILTPLYTQTR